MSNRVKDKLRKVNKIEFEVYNEVRNKIKYEVYNEVYEKIWDEVEVETWENVENEILNFYTKF